MPKTKKAVSVEDLSVEQLEALLEAKRGAVESTDSPAVATASVSDLATAFTKAFEASKPAVKKTVATRVPNTPWSAKPGEVKPKLKRKFFQHSIGIPEERMFPSTILLANKLRPGVFGGGYFKVTRRRDKGIDLDYPIKTVPQRNKLWTDFHLTSLNEILQYCITEAEKPKTQEFDAEGDPIFN